MKTNTFRFELLSVRNLIREKHYDEARAILCKLQHPLAQKWLAKLNEIAPPATKRTLSWREMCIHVIRHPTKETFETVAADPRASALRASAWVFWGTVGGMVLEAVLNRFFFHASRSMFADSINPIVAELIGSLFIGLVFLALFWIGIIVIQTISRILGGKGSYGKLAFAVATYTSFAQLILPLSFILLFVINNALNYIVSIPFAAWLMNASYFYCLFLTIVAVAAVNRFGWAKATAAVLAPLLLVVALLMPAYIASHMYE